MKDIDAIKLPIEFSFPLRTLQDKVYSQEEIFGWFGTTNAAELKTLIVREGQFYLRYGIQLSGNPYYYKMPIQYIAFESANQLKMVVIGLDTRNDMPTKYEIVINLDGTVIEGNSNIKVTTNDLAFAGDISDMYTKADMFGDIDPAIFAGGYTMQVLSKLEQSYIDDLGTPANVDGKPYDASSNPYLLGQPYLVVGSIENIFSYDLYGLNTYNMGMIGQIAKIMKVSLDGYDIKMSNIEQRLSALEQQGN